MKFLFGFLLLLLSAAPVLGLSPQDFKHYPDHVMKVSSIILDLGTQELKRVEGVGSLIQVDSTLYILTAGHVSTGAELKVETSGGSEIAALNIYQDFKNDIALIEIDRSQLKTQPTPLAYYIRQYQALITPFIMRKQSDRPELTPAWLIGPSYTDRFPAIPIDGLESYLTPSGPTVLLQAPWLEQPTSDAVDKIMMNWIQALSRDNSKTQDFKTYQRFPRGYSGAPVIMPHGGDLSHSPVFELAGILTMSTQHEGTSTVTGRAPIQKLIEKAMRKRPDPQNQAAWYLLNDYFVKASDTMILFISQGPVGNGIVVNGKTMELKSKLQLKSNQDLQKMKLSEQDLQKLQQILNERLDSKTESTSPEMKKIIEIQNAMKDQSRIEVR